MITALPARPRLAPLPAATPPRPRPLWTRADTLLVSVLVTLAVLRGLLFATIQWPWYAPDEPDHVEYALLARAQGPLVNRDHIDPALRLAIATSLYEWRVIKTPPGPDDELIGQWVGQVGRQPVTYYLLAGWVSWLAPGDDIGAQLALMRLLSVALGALVVALLYLAGRLAWTDEPLAALGLAGVGLFQTALGGLTGAVNNDILVTLGVTATVTASLWLLRAGALGGRRRWAVAAVLLSLLLAVLTKRTGLAALAPAAMALAVVLVPGLCRWLRARRLVWPAAGLALLLLVALPLLTVRVASEQPSEWVATTVRRVAEASAPDGRHVVVIGEGGRGSVIQRLPSNDLADLLGQRVTLGAWVRLAGPGPARSVILRLEHRLGEEVRAVDKPVTATDTWQFATVTAPIPARANALWAVVTQGQAEQAPVLLDGLLLTEGEPRAGAPTFLEGRQVRWANATRVNYLANGSFEEAPFEPQPWVARSFERLVGRPIVSLWSSEGRSTRPPATPDEWRVLIWEPFFESLWGRLGRTGEINMPIWWYTAQAGLLAAAAVAGLLAGAVAAWRRRWRAPGVWAGAVLALGLAAAGTIALGPYFFGLYGGPPFGRYFLVAILPLAGLYVAGLIMPWPRAWRGLATLALLATLAALDTLALLTVLAPHFGIRPPGPV